MYPVSDLYGQAARYGGVQTVVCDAYRAGSGIATDLRVLSGSVTDVSAPGVRRTLDIELAPALGLWDTLEPAGTELRVRSVLRYPSGSTETVPLGVFDIDSQSLSYGEGQSLKFKGSDKWIRIQRARFIYPVASDPGTTAIAQIGALIRGALGPREPIMVTATSTLTIGSLVWETDRDKAIQELADYMGARVFFDRNGVATVEDLPPVSAPSVWMVDAGATGVMLDGTRERSRSRTYNVVVVASDKADGEAPYPPAVAWDNDPTSATYAGPDPINSPHLASPFGVVTDFHTSSLYENQASAMTGANIILNRVTGRAAQLSLEAVRNHALDSGDVIDVLLPAERYDQDQPQERHIIDRVTHPLLPTGTQSIDTRSTRTDAFT